MRTLVTVSDLHVGSIYGLMPPEFIRKPSGIAIHGGPNNEALFDAWKKLSRAWNKPEVCVVNGDAVDGTQGANRGMEVWSTEMNDQVDVAEELLEMFHAKTYYFTAGTPYHSQGDGMKYEKEIANRFGSELYDDLSAQFRGHTMHFSHHIGVSAVFHYRTTPLARELLTALCNEKSLHKYEWTIRSHAHYTVQVLYKTHRGIITPAWQGRTPYTIRKSPFMVPDIGAVRFAEWKHKKIGDEEESPLSSEVVFWRQPKPDLMDLESRTLVEL